MEKKSGLNLSIVTFILVMILVAVLGLFAGWYFGFNYPNSLNGTATPTATTVSKAKTTPTTTANLKTYTNSRVNYQFEYPSSGLTLALDETIKYPSTSSADAKDEDLVQFATNNVTYSVETRVGITDQTIEDWIKDTNVSNISADMTKYTKTVVGGKTAYTLTGSLATYVMNNGNVYIIKAMQGVAPSTDTTDTIYKNLLSTFQFTS